MPKYTFTVTRDITESTTVTVEADDIGEAHAKAIGGNMDLDGWEVDDNPGGDAYIPDPSEYTTELIKYAVVRENEVTCERKQIGQVETTGDPYEDFHKRFGSCVEYTPMDTTDDESPEEYRRRIGATT